MLMQNQINTFKAREAVLQESIANKKAAIKKEKTELRVISKARIQLEKLDDQLHGRTPIEEEPEDDVDDNY